MNKEELIVKWVLRLACAGLIILIMHGLWAAHTGA